VVRKFKRRKNYRRKQGHRQRYTRVRIESIEA
ncbi:MAG: bL21 family ribosomal protein, partial [Planctomycetota bacterium]|jgi:large subunit ribosomal protein L21